MPTNESGAGDTTVSFWWHLHAQTQGEDAPADGSVVDPYSVAKFDMRYRSPMREFVIQPGETLVAHNGMTDARFTHLLFGVKGGGSLKVKEEKGVPTTPDSTTDFSVNASGMENSYRRLSCVLPMTYDDYNTYKADGTTEAYWGKFSFTNDGADPVTLLTLAISGTEE